MKYYTVYSTKIFSKFKGEIMKTKKAIFENIMNRFAEAVHYKITRDILLYGVCTLETGNTDDLDEIIEIRKELDNFSFDFLKTVCPTNFF